jgi:hypothetical protein
VLTTRAETLLSGAWEGVTLHKALVLSDTPALRGAFGDAAVYVRPSAASIRQGIATALEQRQALETRARTFARVHDAASREQIGRLRSALLPIE